jgi:hypothetical protein
LKDTNRAVAIGSPHAGRARAGWDPVVEDEDTVLRDAQPVAHPGTDLDTPV